MGMELAIHREYIPVELTDIRRTASVSFRNGSIFDVARIDGDEQYREVMDRLSLDSSVHPTYVAR